MSMNLLWKCLVTCFGIPLLVATPVQAADTPLESDFRLVDAPETPVAERDAAIARIKALPYEVVALPLAHAIDAMASPGDEEGRSLGIWNAASPEAWRDPDCPPRDRPFYALNYLWDHFTKSPRAPSGARLPTGVEDASVSVLIGLAKDKSLVRSRVFALGDLSGMLRYHQLSAEVAGELLGLMDSIAWDGSAPLEVRRAALKELFEHSPAPKKYLRLGVTISKAYADSHLAEAENFRNLNAISAFQKFDTHGRKLLVNNTFELLERVNDGQTGAGYFLAVEIGRIVPGGFKPEQSDPKYQTLEGNRYLYPQDTVNNALAWWAQHKQDYR